MLPFKSYLLGTANVSSYTSANLSTTAGTIYPTDECTITAVYSNGACKVTYPISGGTKTAYTQLSNFVANTSTALTSQKVNHQETTYIRASTSSTQYGWIGSGDTIYKMGTSGSMTQVFYPTTSSGWKHAFVATSGLTEPTYDARFNPYCPIRGYIVGTSTIATYEADYTTVAGEIWTTDYCTINAVYANGWVQVSYPAGGGTKTKYAQLSNFIYNPAFVHVKYTANANINVYARPATIGGTIIGWVSPGDVFYVVSTNGSNSQVFYPVDAAYGGGYKFGWCPTSALPQTTYTVSYNANGGSGAPAAQTKTHGVNLTLSSTIPTRTGYTFVGWGTSSSATTAAYAAGAIYTANASITLYAVWTLNKYEISFNANGGFGAPPTQTKTHGVALTLSSTIPQKLYTITYNANGGTVTNASENINCTFSGWGTSSSATTPSYAAGASYTGNENATLYAVWANPTIASYPIPSRNGYVFAGWYTAASGGTELSLTTKITANTTYYAHWDLALYEVFYHANGGQNAPEPQTKTHGVALTLSSEIPTREGFIFLGWSADEFATSPDCMPGSQYAANASIVLFAVWSVVANAETPTITSQPTDKVVDLNAAANLSITAIVSKGTLSYQWYSVASKTNSGGTAIGGATNASYNAPTNVVGTKYYYCVVTNTDNSATGSKTATAVSNAVSVTVNPPVSNALYIVNSATTFAGGTVTIGISLVNNPGIISLRNTVNFDENVLELLSVTDKGLFAGFTPPSATKTSPYTLRWADSFATVNNMANGEFVTVTFKVKSGTPNGSYPVTINHVEARNIDGTELGVANATGYITVNAASSTLRGDVDCNGVVDAADAAAILRFLAGLSELSDRGAINAEVTDVTPGAPNRAAITAEDAAKILRYLANIITVL
ncbi:MAG: InlB B-repeat-containing protein [Clostridiales bacterium]|nr:InlB B-repeat-containing protein [Clostridiales bacterium]